MGFLAQVMGVLTKTGHCGFWSLQQLPETRDSGNWVEEGNKKDV